MVLSLDVDPRSGVPIYVQLVEGVRHALTVGTLRPGERLPTVRTLAEELVVAIREVADTQIKGDA